MPTPRQVNDVPVTPLTRDDIEGVYAGLRPLLAGGTDDTTKLSREHVVTRTQPGMLSVAGGKYTTYRVMAADAVDAAAVDLDRPLPRTVTDRISLLGAEGYPAPRNQLPVLAQRYGLPTWTVRHLLGRYGSLIGEVLAAGEDNPSLLLPMPGAERHLRAEFRYAATHDSALHAHPPDAHLHRGEPPGHRDGRGGRGGRRPRRGRAGLGRSAQACGGRRVRRPGGGGTPLPHPG
ncbi:glycerol-3-phosphate dehydrogenase C-terminal domain-containing protein [Micromonospora marina]|uniref:glycerol-3-phosphate dehydrogenase C-terminal domain-containing protein n=1 Tax=Micromonospora marina TaxID=307120 RepID=UPI0034513B6D